jgi:hypothetical protein
MSNAPFPALVGLLGDQQVQEVLVRQAVASGSRQDGIELLGAQRDLQRGTVGEDAFTQVGRRRR